MSLRIFSALLLTSLLACSHSHKHGDSAAQPAAPAKAPGEVNDLSWADAKARKARVSDVKYALSIKLNDTDLKFTGTNTITFKLSDSNQPLRIDFSEGEVTKITANGNSVPVTVAKKRFQIDLPSESLKVGDNSVSIEYIQDYSRQGTGLHRFQDPETKEVFTYTDFEPYDANRFFPCFDQPDLRASLSLTVEAPKKWVVIANERETAVKEAGANKIWTFPATPPIATYIFAMHAGPYKIWTNVVDGIPLRLLARKSMAKYMRAEEFFTITQQGFRYFNKQFGYKYPFKKYDQIFVPEFNS